MMYTSHLLLLLLLLLFGFFFFGNKRKKRKKKKKKKNRHTLGRTSPDEQTRTSKRFSWDEQAQTNKPGRTSPGTKKPVTHGSDVVHIQLQQCLALAKEPLLKS